MSLGGYGSAVASDLSDPSFLSQVAGYLGGEAAPGIAAYGQQSAQALAQAGVAPAALQEGIVNQTQNTGYDLAQALLGYQGTQLEESGLASQIGTASKQQAIEQEQFGGQQQQLGLQEQGTQLEKANLAYQTPIQYQQQGQQAAATGALNTQGNKQNMGKIQQQAAYQGSQLGLQSQSEYLQGQLNQLGQQSEEVGYQGQQSQYSNQQQQLELAAKAAGIPVQQAISQLGWGIGQLGIQSDPTQAIGQASTAQSGEASGMGAVLAQAGATTGLGPNFMSNGVMQPGTPVRSRRRELRTMTEKKRTKKQLAEDKKVEQEFEEHNKKTPLQDLEGVGKAAEQLLGPVGSRIAASLTDSKPKPKKAGGKKKTTSDEPTAQTPEEIEKEIASNPFNKLGEGLVKQLQQEQAPIEKAISGGDTASAVQSAENQALAGAGVSPGSSAGAWLQSQIATANKNDAPMQQAMEAYGKAYQAGQSGVDQALGNVGQANALGITTAPEQTWLNDLQQHIQSNLSYYGQIPTGAAANLPPALLYYLQQSGTGGAGGTGVTQLSGIDVPGAKTNAPTIPGINNAAAGSKTTSISSDEGSAPS